MINQLTKINLWIEKSVNNRTADPTLRRKGIILIRACFLTSLFMFAYEGVSYFINFTVGVAILPFEGLLFGLLPLLFYFGASISFVGNSFIFIGAAFGLALVTNSGGLYSPIMPWLTLMPICALLFLDRKSALIWAFILLATTLVLALIWNYYGDFPYKYNTGKDIFFFANCYVGLIFIYLGLSTIFEFGFTKANNILAIRNGELADEKEKSESLLLNILPSETAEELKATGVAKAKGFEMVSVLFTDFKGFTQATEKMTAEELVKEIHDCYSEFDKIISNHDLEKIKTIGDSYMCAGGLPVSNTTNATDAVAAALEIRNFIEQEKQKRISENKQFFEIRIGVHTGPVVAGVVGIKKIAYDIWGDTVNIASRMESSGEVGKVNISGATFELVKNNFLCQHRGKISAKNKGEVDMYFVEYVN